jgi:hypothetical protein
MRVWSKLIMSVFRKVSNYVPLIIKVTQHSTPGGGSTTLKGYTKMTLVICRSV